MLRSRPLTHEQDEQVAAAVFHQAFIPRKLEDVTHYERDHDRLATGQNTEGIYYQTIAGMQADLSGVRLAPAVLSQPAAGAAALHSRDASQTADNQGSSVNTAGGNSHSSSTAAPSAAAAPSSSSGSHGKAVKPKTTSSGDKLLSSATVSDRRAGATAASGSRGAHSSASFLKLLPTLENQAPMAPASSSAVAAASEELKVRQWPASQPAAALAATSNGAAGSDEPDVRGDCSTSNSGSDDDSDYESGSDTESASGIAGREGQMSKEELKAARKANKKAVKESNKERRKTKTPKHVKKAHKQKNKK